jgi:hypothetical protein
MASRFLIPICLGLGLTTTAHSHDWYSGLIAEDGIPCCDKRDCHPVGHRNTESKGLEIEIGGVWIPVRPQTVLQTISPDTSAHACYYYGSKMNLDLRSHNYLKSETTGPIIRCVVLPGNS